MDIGKKAAFSIRAVTRMATLAHAEHDTGRAEMRDNVFRYKEESAKVCVGVCLLLNLRLIAFCLIFFLIFFFKENLEVCNFYIYSLSIKRLTLFLIGCACDISSKENGRNFG